jgi:thiamine biosynthesis lipoprotein
MKPAQRASPSFALGGTRSGHAVHRFAHEAMATVFEVRCTHDDLRYARQAAFAAFELVDRLEQDLSRFIANSDVSRVNDLAAGQSTRVSPSTLECLEIARHLFDRTGGAFDISIGSGLDHLELIADEFAVHVRADGVRIDLGGIGKGYAVDRMAELLDEWGIERALVHGGFSSVRALEPPPDRDGWALTLSAPWPGDEMVLARLSARQKALSASGTRKGNHILDPRTGRPARGRAAFVALSIGAHAEAEAAATGGQPDAQRSPAAVAEGLSTAFMLLPMPEIEDLCRRWPRLEAWLASEPTETTESQGNLVHLGSSPNREG